MRAISRRLYRRFPSKAATEFTLLFAGTTVVRKSKVLALRQREYCRSLTSLPPQASFHAFRCLRHQLSWLPLSRPDILESGNISTQTTAASFKRNYIKKINNTVAQACKFADLGMSFPLLERSTLHILAYSDASLATNEEGSSNLDLSSSSSTGLQRMHPIVP